VWEAPHTPTPQEIKEYLMKPTLDEIRNMEAGDAFDKWIATDVMGWVWNGQWHPSTDIAAAFEVLNKLGDVSWSLSPAWSLETGKRIGFSMWLGDASVLADTAPLAICRAVLMAKSDLK
jgi:hypothetical protein